MNQMPQHSRATPRIVVAAAASAAAANATCPSATFGPALGVS